MSGYNWIEGLSSVRDMFSPSPSPTAAMSLGAPAGGGSSYSIPQPAQNAVRAGASGRSGSPAPEMAPGAMHGYLKSMGLPDDAPEVALARQWDQNQRRLMEHMGGMKKGGGPNLGAALLAGIGGGIAGYFDPAAGRQVAQASASAAQGMRGQDKELEMLLLKTMMGNNNQGFEYASKIAGDRAKRAEAERQQQRLLEVFGMGGSQSPGGGVAPAGPGGAPGGAPSAQMPSLPGTVVEPPTAAAGARSSGASNTVPKYGMDHLQLPTVQEMTPAEQQIVKSAILSGDMKAVDEAIKTVHGNRIKLAEQQSKKQELSPEEAGKLQTEKTLGAERAKIQAGVEDDRRKAQLQTQPIRSALQKIVDLTRSNKFSEAAVGSTDRLQPIPWSDATIGGMRSPLTGAGHQGYTDTVANVQNEVRALATIMKPFVRGTGEGAWSDKDQLYLEQLASGELLSARDAAGVRERVAQLAKRIEDTFLSKHGLSMPPLDMGEEMAPTGKPRAGADPRSGPPAPTGKATPSPTAPTGKPVPQSQTQAQPGEVRALTLKDGRNVMARRTQNGWEVIEDDQAATRDAERGAF